MSKKVDLTKPLSEDDLRYLVDRCRWDDLRENAANLGMDEPTLPSSRGLRAQVPRAELSNTDSFDDIAEQLGVRTTDAEGDVAASEKTAADRYRSMTVPQLKEELDKRRADYEAGEDPDMEAAGEVSYTNEDRKDALVQKLVDDDIMQADDE